MQSQVPLRGLPQPAATAPVLEWTAPPTRASQESGANLACGRKNNGAGARVSSYNADQVVGFEEVVTDAAVIQILVSECTADGLLRLLDCEVGEMQEAAVVCLGLKGEMQHCRALAGRAAPRERQTRRGRRTKPVAHLDAGGLRFEQ